MKRLLLLIVLRGLAISATSQTVFIDNPFPCSFEIAFETNDGTTPNLCTTTCGGSYIVTPFFSSTVALGLCPGQKITNVRIQELPNTTLSMASVPTCPSIGPPALFNTACSGFRTIVVGCGVFPNQLNINIL